MAFLTTGANIIRMLHSLSLVWEIGAKKTGVSCWRLPGAGKKPGRAAGRIFQDMDSPPPSRPIGKIRDESGAGAKAFIILPLSSVQMGREPAFLRSIHGFDSPADVWQDESAGADAGDSAGEIQLFSEGAVMLDVIVKLVLAVVLGGIIGLEREFGQKPAGLRTNILICAGSTMMMALSGIILGGAPVGSADSLRIASGVITGMGFIGAGTIIQAHRHVHGLTTASTLWAVAGLGLVIGAGYFLIAAIYTGILTIVLLSFPLVEHLVPHRSIVRYNLRVAGIEAVDELRGLAAATGEKVDEIFFRRETNGAVLVFVITERPSRARTFRDKIAALGEIVEIRID